MRYPKSPNSYQFFIAIILSILLWVVGKNSLPVSACSPAGRFDYIVEERTHAAEIVFEGTVLKNNFWILMYQQSKTPPPNDDYGSLGTANLSGSHPKVTATIIVHQYLKGDGPAIVDVTGFGSGMGDCLSAAESGDHFIFFANGDSQQGFTANYLGVYSATEGASTSNISEAIGASGQMPIEKKLTPKEQLTVLWVKIRWGVGCTLVILLVTVILLGWLGWLKRKNKFK